MTTSIDFGSFTDLPVETQVYPNRSGGVVRVQTPHRGEIQIDLQYDGALDVYDELTTRVVQKIKELEHESKSYLLTRWLKARGDTNSNPELFDKKN